ncbi:MAG TPA: NADH:flavin oxidoreductase [Vicinamibacterales bacterium]|jgi:2,4-dienoyl-CoA reductase-like NADH-dependent reductase (Old Yellow Enzyme family)
MPDLLTPLSLGPLKFRNRIVMPPMWSGQATPEGLVTDNIIDYHRRRAAAGCGLVIVEHAFVHARGRHTPTQLGVHTDATLEGLQKLAAAVRSEGAVVCLQISHAGSRASSRVLGMRPVAPTSVRHPYEAEGDIPEALTAGMIDEILQAFGDAAVRARSAGFSAVELHAAHGFLLSQFLSPLTNLRTDEYGGPIENRSRLHLAALESVRARLGQDFPVFVRLGAHDETAGGLELDDSCWTAVKLAAAGASLIDVSGGLQGSRGMGKGAAYFVPYARAIKAVVTVPVLVTGGISEPALADRAVREGWADLIGIGRAMLNDPDWARKAIAHLSMARRPS